MTLTESIFATAELCGTKLSEPAAMLIAQDLSQFDETQVISALARCRRELKGRLTVAEVLSRIDDGRPGPKEAWALIPVDEYQTTVWTDEICDAASIAAPLLESGDKHGARLAFEERYVQLVSEARAAKKPVRWWPTLGWDIQGREAPIQEAVQLGRLRPADTHRLLPEFDLGQDRKAIPAAVVPMPDEVKEQIKQVIGNVKAIPPPTMEDLLKIKNEDLDKERRKKIESEIHRHSMKGKK